MADAYICRRGGSGVVGGAELVIVGGTTRPAKATPNTIWIGTDAEITSYVLSVTEPENPVEGMTWVVIDGSGNIVATFPVGGDWITVYLRRVKQYISGEWVEKSAMIYQGGAWVDIKRYLFNEGVIDSLLTGGIYGTNDGTALVQESTAFVPGQNVNYTTKKKVDLTGFSRIKARFTSTNTTEHGLFRMFIDETAKNGASLSYSDAVSYYGKYGPFNGNEFEVELSLEGVAPGSYYLGWGVGLSSNSPENIRINGKVLKWWLE